MRRNYCSQNEPSATAKAACAFTDIDKALGNEFKMPESREKVPDHFSGKVHFSAILGPLLPTCKLINWGTI